MLNFQCITALRSYGRRNVAKFKNLNLITFKDLVHIQEQNSPSTFVNQSYSTDIFMTFKDRDYIQQLDSHSRQT